MTWTLSTAVAEFFYCIIGLIFIGTGFKALKDPTCEKRITTAAFWFYSGRYIYCGSLFPQMDHRTMCRPYGDPHCI